MYQLGDTYATIGRYIRNNGAIHTKQLGDTYVTMAIHSVTHASPDGVALNPTGGTASAAEPERITARQLEDTAAQVPTLPERVTTKYFICNN